MTRIAKQKQRSRFGAFAGAAASLELEPAPKGASEQRNPQDKSGVPPPTRRYLTIEMPLRAQSDMRDVVIPSVIISAMIPATGRLGRCAFDNSSWPVALHGRWLVPEFNSDDFVWVRILVRADTGEPLALRIGNFNHALIADEVFINGTHIGSFGRLPPSPFVEGLPLGLDL